MTGSRPRCWQPLLRRLRRDDGMATVWMLYTGLIVVVLAGVVLGGGVVFGARTHGYDLAQQAARAGAQEIDLAAYRTNGTLRLDPARAAAAANRFLAAAGATGTVAVTAAQITVTATSQQDTPMLAGFGHPTVSVTATASATPVAGPPP
ncbi:hypothetical protein [Virgisporangium aurantiacum]|nr:hypothetical protein [Virgisporangium aurantiacum]